METSWLELLKRDLPELIINRLEVGRNPWNEQLLVAFETRISGHPVTVASSDWVNRPPHPLILVEHMDTELIQTALDPYLKL